MATYHVCNFCQNWHEQPLGRVIEKTSDSGSVNMLYRTAQSVDAGQWCEECGSSLHVRLSSLFVAPELGRLKHGELVRRSQAQCGGIIFTTRRSRRKSSSSSKRIPTSLGRIRGCSGCCLLRMRCVSSFIHETRPSVADGVVRRLP